MVVSTVHEAEKSHSSRMKSILEAAVSLSPPDHRVATRTESSVSLLAARHDPDVALREQAAAALLTRHLPIIVLDESSERPPSESPMIFESDRSLILLLIGSASDDPAEAIERATEAGDWAWAAEPPYGRWPSARILAGSDGAVVRLIVECSEFGESEPLLLAAAALAHSWFDIAESALVRAG